MTQAARNPQVALAELLSEDPAAARQRERSTFDKLAAPFEQSLVIYGAGNLGRKTLAGLRRIGIEPQALADSNPALRDQAVDGLPVMAPRVAAQQFGARAAFVVAVWSPGPDRRFSYIERELRVSGCSRVVSFVPLFWKYPEVFLPHCRIDLPHKILDASDAIRRALALFQDEESQREFLIQLGWLQSWAGFDDVPAPSSCETYLPSDIFTIAPDEVFVDCGAYDGDTMRAFLRRAGPGAQRMIAFEPDPTNYEKLESWVATLPPDRRARITLHKLGLGARRERLRFDASGSVGSAISPTGTIEIEVATLDEILSPSGPDAKSLGAIPTYVKMDIEGAEIEALEGGRRTIREHTPALAACVYHRQDHLWRIPLLMYSLNGQYRLFLRRYGDEFADVVCYAVPPERIRR